MDKLVKTEFNRNGFGTDIVYEVSPDYYTTYKFKTYDYSSEHKEKVECLSLHISESDSTQPNKVGLTDLLNAILFDLRLRQVSAYPDVKYDNAIKGILIALKALTDNN